MEMHNLAAVNAAIAAIETSAELENEPVSLEAQDDKDYILAMDWPFRLGIGRIRFVRPCNAWREFQRSLGLKVAIAVTPRSLVYLLVCF